MEQRELVEQVGEPLALLLPRHVQTPDGVVQGLVAHGHLGGERLLREVHQGTANQEVLGEVVFPVHAKHGFAFKRFGRAFQTDVDRRAGVENALVDDGHLAGGIVHGVVAVFHQRHTACRHHDRAAGHVHGAERDDVARGGFVLSGQDELVFLDVLLRLGAGGVVEGLELIFLGHDGVAQYFVEVAAEGFHAGEEDASLRAVNGVAFHEVEVSVRVQVVLVVQAVQAQKADERLVLELLFGQVVEVNARRVAQVFDVEPEAGLFHRSGAQ